jgi:hypothetical protein
MVAVRKVVWGLVGAVLLVGLVASAGWGQALRAVLVDRKVEPPEGQGPVGFQTGQVKLIFPDKRTKLLPYRSYIKPQVADGRVYIFTTKDGKLTSLVIYQAQTDKAETFPVPKGLDPYFGAPSFSPDGAKVAYYVVGKDGKGKVGVNSWPGWRLLRESPVSPLRATDTPPYAPIWKGKNLVEFDEEFFDPPRLIILKCPD